MDTQTNVVATGHEPVATQTDLVATGREPVATQTDPVATEHEPVATVHNPVATERVGALFTEHKVTFYTHKLHSQTIKVLRSYFFI